MANADSSFFLVYVGSPKVERFAKISPQDAEIVLRHGWKVHSHSKSHYFSKNQTREQRYTFYAHSVQQRDGKTVRISMHRLIMNPPEGVFVDHINGDGLDNRRENLRLVTRQQNMANSRKRHVGQSKYKGVSRARNSPKWRACIVVNKKQIHLGTFDDELDAARAYDLKAVELYGEHAFTNGC
jgi:hypothetical protein